MVVIQIKPPQSLVAIHTFDVIETEQFVHFRIEHVFRPIEISLFYEAVIVDDQPK